MSLTHDCKAVCHLLLLLLLVILVQVLVVILVAITTSASGADDVTVSAGTVREHFGSKKRDLLMSLLL